MKEKLRQKIHELDKKAEELYAIADDKHEEIVRDVLPMTLAFEEFRVNAEYLDRDDSSDRLWAWPLVRVVYGGDALMGRTVLDIRLEEVSVNFPSGTIKTSDDAFEFDVLLIERVNILCKFAAYEKAAGYPTMALIREQVKAYKSSPEAKEVENQIKDLYEQRKELNAQLRDVEEMEREALIKKVSRAGNILVLRDYRGLNTYYLVTHVTPKKVKLERLVRFFVEEDTMESVIDLERKRTEWYHSSITLPSLLSSKVGDFSPKTSFISQNYDVFGNYYDLDMNELNKVYEENRAARENENVIGGAK